MMPASTRPEQRKAMEGLLADLKKVVCEITVETNVAGATISVDGRKVGDHPRCSPVSSSSLASV
jgi:hypothetical protein